jgi:hypothetical protein
VIVASETIEKAKQEFLQEKDRLKYGLSTTLDERLNWSPSETARTPIQLVAHAAYIIGSLHRTLDGYLFSIPTTAEADRSFREFERDFTTREQVLELLEQSSAAYVAWLDALSEFRLSQVVKMPFSLCDVPMRDALGLPAQHIRWHAAQIDYMQTIYGDHDWYVDR